MNDIVSIISTLGFPIAMCLYFAWDKHTTTEKTNDILNQMAETLAVIKDYIEKEE